jgi:uncharacterized protein (TIGR02284 family)
MINDYEATHPITDPDYATAKKPVGSADNDDVISCLNGLIETCKDGQEGFQEAAEGVDDHDLKQLFYECSQQRAQFSGELQSLVRSIGGDPETSSSFTGALHRGWMNLKTAITGNDDKAILNECERGEDSAKSNYKAALELDLPANIAGIVQTQYAAVQSTHDNIKALRDEANRTDKSSSAATGF